MTGSDPPEPADDLYATLGLLDDSTAADITNAYRRLARQHHPDANPDAEADRFAGLTDAYDVLRDPDRRSAYDRTRRSRADAAHAARGVRIPVRRPTPSEQAARSAPSPGPGVPPPLGEVMLPISFDQAALGTTATVPVQATVACPDCGGSGEAVGGPAACPDCDGRGSTVRASGGISIRHECARCDGAGRLPAPPCSACEGEGLAVAAQEVAVRIPAGVDTGSRLKVNLPAGLGGQPLTAVVEVAPHPYFGRRGHDLTLALPITLAEAALGGVVSVPTLTGAIAIRIPPGTPHGRTLRARGRGIPAATGAGDLLVTVHVDTPAELNDEQRAALEAYAAATASPRAHLESPGS